MDVFADVSLLRDEGRTGVQARPAPVSAPPQATPSSLPRRRARPAPWGRRRRTRRPASHLHAGVRCAGLADHAPVLGERLRVRSAPSSCSSFVEPSTSVKRNVTVPVGSPSRIDDLEGKCDGVIKRQRTARGILRIESLLAECVDRSGGGLHVELLVWRGGQLLQQLVEFPEQPGRRPGIRGGDRRDFETNAIPPGIEVEPSAKALASVAHAPCRGVLDRRAPPRARHRRMRPTHSSPTDSKYASASSYSASASENLPCFRATPARLPRGTPTSIPSSRPLASTSWYTAFARSRSPRSSAT